MSHGEVTAVVLFSVLAGLLFGFLIAVGVISKHDENYRKEISELKTEAVKSGTAYWKVDPVTGGTTFTWKYSDTAGEK